jgi:single-strand DNA-binding protein
MSSLNKAMIIGRLGADPDVRYTQDNTPVATISVATSVKYKDSSGNEKENTEWHRVIAWAKLAEICQKYLKKGSLVYFEGSLNTRKWTDKDGIDRYTTEIKAYSMQMLDTKKDKTPHPVDTYTDTPNQEYSGDVDDDLPF